jgi:hypothetical protein
LILRRVVHRSRPITSQISASGVPAATSSANSFFSDSANGLCISHLLIDRTRSEQLMR